ncbi:MAG: HAD family phosphatase [Lachnospiraceae bacterium]|nr:HAD family phosphatase [Lachnospiraceae bacterium]
MTSVNTKLFFFDLDGTLLNTQKNITEQTYAALTAWHNAGHRVAVSSGRPLFSILDTIKQQHLDVFSPYAIAFNGAQIHEPATGKDIWKKTLSVEDVHALAALIREAGLYCHTYDNTHILTPREDTEIHYYTRVVKVPWRVLPDFPEGVCERPCKMLCIDLNGPERLDVLARQIMSDPRFTGRITAMRSNEKYLEIFPSDAGKGAAVAALADHLGIPVQNTYAAGDAQNDVSMIEAAECGVAMCNGHPDAIAAADIVTATDNDHDGLAPILRGNI